MARGQQKIQAQQKAQQKKSGQKKKSTPGEFEKNASKALKVVCESCKIQMLTAKMLKDHWDAKHSKLPYPKEIKDL
eukprot:m.138179 g.138179  ORF g.138179 m.138179 type:complete len:76 (+) comp13518_c0_seq1:43-270(+)